MTLASLHPIVVHFTIVLVIMGVAFKLVSLFGRPAFAGPAATTLLLLGAVSAFVSAQSGTAAHGPVERAPGARPPVMEHEEWGERTNQIMLGVGVIELAGLALRRWASAQSAPTERAHSKIRCLPGGCSCTDFRIFEYTFS